MNVMAPFVATSSNATTNGPGNLMALSVTGLTKRYKSGFMLDDITFDLPAGYIMGLIGPNGAGKSTLIRLILNMTRRDAGSIDVFGLDAIADEETVKGRIGVVFDANCFIDAWTVGKTGRAMRDMYSAWDAARFDDCLRRFGLDRSTRVGALSRGMQMRLMLAVALSHHARLLILDEPTAGLDVLARDDLMDLLRDYVADCEAGVLFSTHITADLERSADLITYITGGRLYYTGPKDEFEDSFRIVRGGPDDLTDGLVALALGIRRYDTGFDALVRAERAGALAAASRTGGHVLVVEPAGIDDIVRLTNMPADIEEGWQS
ncbi:ABC transporter ATP-binding protein [Bifidobacterium ramosum]|uniref:ABC transporter ATP-binding protein n=2 Tax=Bifidobacterium ramosum TaxID=1798158 RepID=A0A6L4X2J7_9BIFI|nr:ABC transporter ATP-binding protein [Bifidobacterium ramosum]